MKTKLKCMLLSVVALLITGSSFAQRPNDTTHWMYDGYDEYAEQEQWFDSACATRPNCDSEKGMYNALNSPCCNTPRTFIYQVIYYCPPPDFNKIQKIRVTMAKCVVITDTCRVVWASYDLKYRCPGDTIIYDSIPPYPSSSFKKDHEIKELEDMLSRKTSQTSFGVISQAIEITAYPNPASDAIILHSDGDIYVESISLINIMGQEVKKLNLNRVLSPGSSNTIDISNVPNGIYSVVSKTPEGLKTYIISIKH